MQDLPNMPPLQPIFTAAQPTPYEQMLLTLMEAESMLYRASAMAAQLNMGIGADIADLIDTAAEHAAHALRFARKPPEPERDDDPAFTRDEERHIERAREADYADHMEAGK